jgi:hypothetical protein
MYVTPLTGKVAMPFNTPNVRCVTSNSFLPKYTFSCLNHTFLYSLFSGAS